MTFKSPQKRRMHDSEKIHCDPSVKGQIKKMISKNGDKKTSNININESIGMKMIGVMKDNEFVEGENKDGGNEEDFKQRFNIDGCEYGCLYEDLKRVNEDLKKVNEDTRDKKFKFSEISRDECVDDNFKGKFKDFYHGDKWLDDYRMKNKDERLNQCKNEFKSEIRIDKERLFKDKDFKYNYCNNNFDYNNNLIDNYCKDDLLYSSKNKENINIHKINEKSINQVVNTIKSDQPAKKTYFTSSLTQSNSLNLNIPIIDNSINLIKLENADLEKLKFTPLNPDPLSVKKYEIKTNKINLTKSDLNTNFNYNKSLHQLRKEYLQNKKEFEQNQYKMNIDTVRLNLFILKAERDAFFKRESEMEVKSRQENIFKRMLVCCNQKFLNLELFKMHKAREHGERIEEDEEIMSDEDPYFFKDEQLDVQVAQVPAENVEMVNVEKEDKEEVKTEKKKKVVKPRIFKCTQPNCDRSYTSSYGLNYHVRTGHNDTMSKEVKPYRCKEPGCSKRYKNSNGLKYHVNKRHGK